ncbi:YidC/Oxa1 family insertase periplasmic-domain containing protein [Candidatus Latescibacterota bacterium]
MDKNFIVAIVISTLVIIVFTSPQYQKRFGKPLPEKPMVESTVPESQIASEQQNVSEPKSLRPVEPVKISTPNTSPQTEQETVQATDVIQLDKPTFAETITLTNEEVTIDISTASGSIIQATMNQFDGISDDDHPELVLSGRGWCSGSIVDGDTIIEFSDIIFTATNHTRTSITLSAQLNDDRSVTRLYTLDDTGYMLHTQTSLDGAWNDPDIHYTWHGPVNNTEAPVKMLRIFPFSLFMRDETAMYKKMAYLGHGDRVNINGKGKKDESRIYAKEGSQKVTFKKGSGVRDTFKGDLDWYAIRNKYFMTAAIPRENKRWSALAEARIVNYDDIDTKWLEFTIAKSLSAGDVGLDIYLGPISYELLKSYGNNLTEVMEMSWRFVRPLSIAFLWVIKKIRVIIPNWGLVIILFSVFIKTVLYPLSRSSLKSMHKMSSLQPQITEIREKYKNNQQKQHSEIMALYKTEGINPLGGCLPILLQMPVFFALYPVVGRAFELRKAMFIPHWIEDLSRPDPYYILPVSMGISMFIQSKATMKDPNQKAMLYIMPVMMVVLFSNFSSGLTLYWFMFNVMTAAQQKLIRT